MRADQRTKTRKRTQAQAPAFDGSVTRTRFWLACAGLCALTWLAYSNSFAGGMVLDNKVLLLEDPRVRAVTPENVNLILLKSYWWPYIESALYRPITTLSYLFNYAVLGNGREPAGYHAINLLLHTANVLLLFAVALRVGRRHWPAFFIAAIWAAHPLSTEAVTNIIGRADLLAAGATLGAFLAYLHASESEGSKRLAWLVVTAAVTTIGVFSKESAVAVLGLVMLYDLTFRLPAAPLSRLVSGWMAIVVPLVFLWYARAVVLAGVPATFPVVDNPIIGADFWAGRLTALAVIPRYLWLIVWPQRLSADYSYNQIPIASGRIEDWVAWIVVLAAVAGTLAVFARSRLMFFAAAAAFISFVPASNLLIVSGTIMAERLVYLASAGVIACVVIAVQAPALDKWRNAVTATLCIVTIAFGARTWIRNGDWRDDLSLWSATARTSPRSFKAHGALAEALYNSEPSRSGRAQVITEKEISLSILKDVPDPVQISLPYREAAAYHLEYGEALLQHDKSAAALERSTEAFKRASGHIQKYLSLLESERSTQQPGSAAADPRAGNITKDAADGYRLLSSVSVHLSDLETAADAARRAQALEPLNPISYRGLAAVLIEQRRYDNAAITLLTGVMLTGNTDLRSAAADLYRAGLDQKGCAVTSSPNGPSFDSSCEIVRQHMCAASRDAASIQRVQGRPDLAQSLDLLAAREFKCQM
jgi:protein O-mannosyl-transferase